MLTDDDFMIRVSYNDELDQWGAWLGENLIGVGDGPDTALTAAAVRIAEDANLSPIV